MAAYPETGVDTLNKLFADFLFVTDGLMDQSVLVEVLIVDDDDYDLSSEPPTPHSAEIIPAFEAHGWSEPVDNPWIPVKVEWVGPLVDPIDPFDYAVHWEWNPPYITLIATEKGGRAVESWQIGRSKSGSGGWQDLGTIHADWDGPANNITVEVGTIPTKPVQNVNVVEIPAQSTSNWSSITLKLGIEIEEPPTYVPGHLKVRAQSYPDNANNGGRVFGTVEGDVNNIVAYAIGDGGSAPGTLYVDGDLKYASLATLPDGCLIDAGRLTDLIVVDGALDGDITAESMPWDYQAGLRGEIRVLGELIDSTGCILVDEDIEGRIYIAGNMDGDIHTYDDWDPSGGEILGDVTIDGVFDGDICGTNLVERQSSEDPVVPENIDIYEFGENATICRCSPDHCRDIGLHADVYPVPGGDGAVEGFDILCILDAANATCPEEDTYGCLEIVPPGYAGAGYMAGDIYPCYPPDGAVEGFDILAVLDAANEDPWCRDPSICFECGRSGGAGGDRARGGGREQTDGVEEARAAFVTFLTTATPSNETDFTALVTLTANWLAKHMTCEERAELAEELQNASLKFASDFAANLVPEIVGILVCE